MHKNPRKKVYVIGTYYSYASSIYNRDMVDKIEDADVIVLTGGADVDPSTYGKPAEPESYGYKARDIFEISEYKKIRDDQVVVGICRGAQLLTVLNGGILVQHVTGHCNGGHKMIDTQGKIYPISSLHHQMCYPFDIPKSDYEVLFTSYPARSTVYKGDGVDREIIEANGEPEIIIYHKEGEPIALAVQGHPEMMDEESRTVAMFNDLIDECIEMARKRKEDV